MERVQRVPTDRGLGVRPSGSLTSPPTVDRGRRRQRRRGVFLPRCEEERRSLRLKRERDEADSYVVLTPLRRRRCVPFCRQCGNLTVEKRPILR